MRFAVWAALGWMAGILAHGALARPPGPPRSPRGVLPVEGVVARVPDEDRRGRRVLVDVDRLRVQVFEPAGEGVPLLPGDRVRALGPARFPGGFDVEGALDRARLARARGIDLELAAHGGIARLDAPAVPSMWRAAGWLRARAEVAFAAASAGDGGALLSALVLGRRRDVPAALEDAFRRAGVAHVLSVSGLHLAAAALFAYLGARRAWLCSAWLTARVPADRAAALVALPAAAGYALITGAEIATLRALVCAAVVLGGRALGRRTDGLTALAVAALALLAASPLSLYEPSFQLSFAAAAALAMVNRRREPLALPAPPAWRRRLRAMLVTSLAATAATAPLTALHFASVQPGGVLANLVVVPLAEMVVLPLGLIGALLGALAPWAGATFIALAALAAGGLARLVAALAQVLPSLDVPPPRPHELALLALAVVAGLALPPRRAWKPVAVALALCGASYALSLLPGRDLRVTFLDVGEGDSALIETPAGERWLIDGGGRLFGDGVDPGAYALRPFLAARRVGRLDLAVVSHPHPDHYGGLAALIDRVVIDELWLTGDDPEDERWDQLVATLAARGTRIRRVGVGETRVAGATRLAVLYPGAPDALRSVNDNSLVLRVEHAGRSVLLPGDVEAVGEATTAAGGRLAADVVKVPHHGSPTSSSPAFVAAARPRLAIISCGRDNRFGFPAEKVVAAWRGVGATVLRTDERGAITVTVGEDGELRWSTRR